MITNCYLPGNYVGCIEYFDHFDKTDKLPNDEEKKNFIISLILLTKKTFNNSVVGGEETVTGSPWHQEIFNQCVQDACVSLITGEEEVKRFSVVKDHYNRDITRLIVNSKPNICKYIVDSYSNLDVRLTISNIKRFFLTHIPRRWSNINFDDIVPRILFRMNVWESSTCYYRITMYSCPMDLEYSYKIENARCLVGLPRIVNPKEVKCYERSDFDVRRAIFGESTRVFKR
jgi:hypothetical protein